jgi:methionyl-tRNA formyltransferase
MRTVSNKSDFDSFRTMNHFMGIACNFDLIIPDSYIKSREGGVLNVHASDLPLDRGISPVVWAFCRGDSKIYISYYLMDGGIDTGEIVKKDVFKIDRDWSLFRAYCEVILYAASSLDNVIDEVNHNIGISITEINHEEKRESYNSWPSKELNLVMKKIGKKYFKIRDISYIHCLIKEIRRGRRLTKL